MGKRGDQWTEILSWEPRAFLYHNFLSKEECEYLISLVKPHMVKSTVVDRKTGQSKDSRVRTSSGIFLKRGQDKTIRDIEKRIADFTFIPAAEAKVAGEMKLAEARSTMEDAQNKFTEAEEKLRAAESLEAEGSRYHRTVQRKLHEIKAREDDLKRRLTSF